MQDYVDNYCKIAEEETRFRDLFGKQELKETKREYHARYSRKMTYYAYLKKKTEQKLKEQGYED